MQNYETTLKLINISLIVSAISTISCFVQVDFLAVSNPPGAVTGHSNTLVEGEGVPIPVTTGHNEKGIIQR